MLLERVDEMRVVLVEAERAQRMARNQVQLRNHDMDMRLALHQLAGRLVDIALDARQVRLSVEAVFVRTVRVHRERFEIAGDPKQRFAIDVILFERQGDRQVALTLRWCVDRLNHRVGQVEITDEHDPLVQVIAIEFSADLAAFLEVLFDAVVAAGHPNQHDGGAPSVVA
ncbi:hypothetical protein [Burkholderia cenocepacia]|uniref:hypothetical protein n=1 Tax=Burkholderia cenocepacia TaxID=95486 RepID=UPI001F24BF24|nr:hypothetical protein [Burkholderia cenocepacia]